MIVCKECWLVSSSDFPDEAPIVCLTPADLGKVIEEQATRYLHININPAAVVAHEEG